MLFSRLEILYALLLKDKISAVAVMKMFYKLFFFPYIRPNNSRYHFVGISARKLVKMTLS